MSAIGSRPAPSVSTSTDGGGLLDCDGGHPSGNITVTVDHATDDSDPMCLLGCREGSRAGRPGPHQSRVPSAA
jgi:hypothetical protein